MVKTLKNIFTKIIAAQVDNDGAKIRRCKGGCGADDEACS